MPFASIDLEQSIFNFEGSISSKEIKSIVDNNAIRRVQASSPVSDTTWQRLNTELFAGRPDIELRVYSFIREECDLSFVRYMTNVHHFGADCLRTVQNLDVISEMTNLKSLSIGVYELENFSVLEDVSPNLTNLSLHATKSKKPNLSILSRFENLRVLYLEGQQKNIEVLSQLENLEDLTLRSISTPGLDYLPGLAKLWSLDVKLGGIKNISAIMELPSLKYLELWRVRGLVDLSVISNLPSLQNLFLQSLRHVTNVPSLQKCAQLRRIVLEDMKGMTEFDALEHAPALQEFLLVNGATCVPSELIPVLRNPTVVRASAYFGSDKRNQEFAKLVTESGKSPWEWTPFQYL